MPIDFIDQLSKFEKSPIVSIRMPFVIAGVSEGSVNTSLESKDLVLLDGQKIKYFDEAKTILDNNKGKTISAVEGIKKKLQ
jgi:regulator of sigma E protease